jgi:hypothetical protein
MTDEGFFAAVRDELEKRAVLTDLGIDDVVLYAPIAGRNAGLKLWKSSWIIPCRPEVGRGVGVHYEVRDRRELRIDVELDPYEPFEKLRRDPVRLRRVVPALLRKTRMIDELRWLFRNDAELCSTTGAHTRNLRDAGDPQALGAVKFWLKVDDEVSPNAFASEIDRVLRPVTSLVDAVTLKERLRV